VCLGVCLCVHACVNDMWDGWVGGCIVAEYCPFQEAPKVKIRRN
jgi:hypothetical protein